MADTGEQRLRAVFRTFRPQKFTYEPIQLQPSSALEAILIERIQVLEQQIVQLNMRINWLIGLIVTSLLAIVINYIIT